MQPFHVSIHARPEGVSPGPTITIAGDAIATLNVSRQALATPFAVSFEQAVAAMERLPRLFIEPDGSFVWTSPQAETAWQLDGNLLDRQERLLLVDLKGKCPPVALDQLLSAFGWPGTTVMFQLMREAVFVSEAEFRRLIIGRSGS